MRNIVKYLLFAVISITAIILVVITSLYSKINQKNNKEETKTDIIVENPAEDLVLRLLIWEGHAPEEHTESFEKYVEEKYGRKIKLENTYGLAYNSDLLDNEPQSWDIFWDSRFKDKYVIGLNEYSYNITITALALGYPRESINDYDFLNNE